MVKPDLKHVIIAAFATKSVFFHATWVDVAILAVILVKLGTEHYFSSKTIQLDTTKVLEKVSSLENKLAALGFASKMK